MKYSNYFNLLIARVRAKIYKLFFKSIGRGVSIFSLLKVEGAHNIVLGDHVSIAKYTWLAALPLTGEKKCILEIAENCSIGNFNHIYATRRVKICRDVLTADKVYIADNSHGYENILQPISKQPIKQIGDVEIGEGTWLCENVCVIGVKIGKHCVIGANSVVTIDIPDFCVAVGAPARIVKKYCPNAKQWRKTDSSGNFLI